MYEYLLVFMGLNGLTPNFYEGWFPLAFDTFEGCLEAYNIISDNLEAGPPHFEYHLGCYANIEMPGEL